MYRMVRFQHQHISDDSVRGSTGVERQARTQRVRGSLAAALREAL